MPPAPHGDTRDSAPDLVGRRRELSWLRTRLDLATRGYGHLVLVEGDAGIGKTRLVEEFLVGARSAGVAVVRGRSYEHLDLSYLPLREALFAPLARELASRPGRERDVAVLERVGALGDLDLDDLPEGEAGDREHTRQMLAVTRLVIEAARARPTAVFIDDLDWADRATLDLVRHLLFRMADEPVALLLIGTTRSDPGARAAGSLSRLRSDPRVATLSLHPLTELEATEFARQLAPAGNVEHARRLATAGNGNPLLIEALAQESRRGSSPDPLSSSGAAFGASHHPVTDAIATRLLTLGPAARAAARAAAFLQPGCTRDVLAAATGFDGPTLDAALADAIAHGVLVDDPEYPRVTHPLFAHTLIEEMPGPTRREFHAKIAAVLAERRDAGEPIEAGALAHHLIEAGDRADPSVVAEVARRAGDEAMARTAWNEAARCYEAAIAALPLADPVDRAALHRSAGLAHRGDIELGTAVKHFALAIDLLGPDADPVLLAELHVWRIRCGVGSQTVLGEARDRGALEQLVERIVDTDPELAAEGLVELAQSYWVDWEMAHAAENARRAMDLAESIGSHRAFVRAVTTLSVPQWAEYDLHGSLETLEAGIAHARAARDDSVLVGARCFARRSSSPGWVASPRPRSSRSRASRWRSARTIRSRRDCRSPRSPRSPSREAGSPRPSSTRTRPCSCSACPGTTGPPVSTCRPSPRASSPRVATTAPARPSTPGPRPATRWSRPRSSSTGGWWRPASAARRCRANGCRARRPRPCSVATRGRPRASRSRAGRVRRRTSRAPGTSCVRSRSAAASSRAASSRWFLVCSGSRSRSPMTSTQPRRPCGARSRWPTELVPMPKARRRASTSPACSRDAATDARRSSSWTRRSKSSTGSA